MATEHFCLRWNNHQSTLISVFDNLLESGTLVDCTLAADGRYLKAHKVVLSACSPYLGTLLSQHYDKHPIIILKDVKFDELKAMLDYMYRGEVNISQEQLTTFLKAAETLQIKGLTDTGAEEGNGHPNRPPSSSSTTSAPNEDPPSPGEGGSSPGPRKRKRMKHDDMMDGGESKATAGEASDRVNRDGNASGTGSPCAKGGSVKREASDVDGDGHSVDDGSDSSMMSRPGPSNGGGGGSTNNRGSPWILSTDSVEEMQLTPGQDKKHPAKEVGKKRGRPKKNKEDPEKCVEDGLCVGKLDETEEKKSKCPDEDIMVEKLMTAIALVKSGENKWKIAREFGLPVNVLSAATKKYMAGVEKSEEEDIVSGKRRQYKNSFTETDKKSERTKEDIKNEKLKKAAELVKRGEDKWKIAQEYGLSWGEITAATTESCYGRFYTKCMAGVEKKEDEYTVNTGNIVSGKRKRNKNSFFLKKKT